LNNSFAEFGGTSMACAHLSGVLALMASLYPGIDLARVREVLQQTSDPHDHEPFKPIGTGRVNALKALDSEKEHGTKQ